MKDQYFGDARDYLKYHLLEELVRTVPKIRQLTCLWMLTPPDGTTEGNIPFIENTELPELTQFLRSKRDSDRRVFHMREYYAARGITYNPRGDERPYFARHNRDAYFRGIPAEHLQGAIVFLDPDIGLAFGKPTPKHLAVEELVAIHARSDAESVLVLYQHYQHKKDFACWMAREINRLVPGPIRYITERHVAFYVIPKSAENVAYAEVALQAVDAASASRHLGPFS